jgi:hypothetical protein
MEFSSSYRKVRVCEDHMEMPVARRMIDWIGSIGAANHAASCAAPRRIRLAVAAEKSNPAQTLHW